MASSLSFAQTFGIKGGLNLSSLSDDGSVDNKTKAGFNAGVFLNAPLSENFSIQPEVLYNDLGSKTTYKISGEDNNLKYSTNLGYISVPVMFQYNATPEFYLEAGPEFSFLVNANSKLKSGSNSDTYDLDTDDFNTFNFGLGIGAGYWITPQFGINARYNAGFTKIGNDDTLVGSSFGDAKNNNFMIGLAYKFK